MTTRARALVVGVPWTDFDSKLPSLPGAQGDAEGMKRLLVSRGFAATDVETPSGANLKARRVQQQLLDLAAVVEAGELGIFYFSGHGYRLPDGSGDERDDWDECIVCSDDVIIDDWFRDVFWPATKPDSRWVACVDACHSDSAASGALPQSPLRLEVPSGRTTSASSWRLILAACGESEEALYQGQAGPDPARSAVTKAILRSLKGESRRSYEQLWGDVVERIEKLRQLTWWIGDPRMWYSGSDERLKHARAFHV